jgi:hypothetical protein
MAALPPYCSICFTSKDLIEPNKRNSVRLCAECDKRTRRPGHQPADGDDYSDEHGSHREEWGFEPGDQ